MNNKKVFTNCLMLGAFAVSSLFIAGCRDSNGGGFIEKADGEKATFGFQLKCDTDESGAAKVTGKIQFNDHGAKVNLHGVPDAVPMNSCTDAVVDSSLGIDSPSLGIDLRAGQYSGTYAPHPAKLGQGGRFSVVVNDSGASGKDKNDSFSIKLSGGVYDGYQVSGFLKGGNIKVK